MTFEERDAVIGRIKISTNLKDMAGADFVVETVTMAPSSP
jgi:3-hydroxyacyl-CoA dehydrogenase